MDFHKFYALCNQQPVKTDFLIETHKVCLPLLKMARPGLQATTFHGLPIPSKISSAFNTAKRHSLSIPALTQSIYFFNKEAVIRTLKSRDANP